MAAVLNSTDILKNKFLFLILKWDSGYVYGRAISCFQSGFHSTLRVNGKSLRSVNAGAGLAPSAPQSARCSSIAYSSVGLSDSVSQDASAPLGQVVLLVRAPSGTPSVLVGLRLLPVA